MHRTMILPLLLMAALTSCPAPLPFVALSLARVQIPKAERDNCLTFDVQLFEGETLRYSTPAVNLTENSIGGFGARLDMISLNPNVSKQSDVALINTMRARCTAKNGATRTATKPFPQPYLQQTIVEFTYAEFNP